MRQCHGQKFLVESSGDSVQTFMSYQESVHGLAIEKGSKKAAVCTDCHGSHEILPANDEKSPIYKFNVPQTCGKCHAEVAQTFMQSIHGQGISRGNGLAPVCTDCHGIHSIKAHIDPNSSVSEQNVARTTCARCHEGVRLSQEFGVAGNRVPVIWIVITGWLQRAARSWWPTAQAAMGYIIFCPPAILAPLSIERTWMQPAASVIRELHKDSL